MSIQEELRAELKAATRARDAARLEVIRAVETEMTVVRTGKGFEGEVNDALYLQVIGAYSKKMEKARMEYEGLGERGKEMAEKLAFEVKYLSRWLPSKLDEAGTRALVKATIATLGVSDVKQAGRVMGQIMKEHKDEVDGGLVNKLVREELAGGG